jgi:acetyltransferase-like isoleucine patch superfamily enzyme
LLKLLYKLLNRPIPYYAEYPFWLLIWKPIRKFINVAIIPNIPFNYLRITLYRLIGYKIGRGVFIGMRCYLDDTRPYYTIIENNVTISYCVKFATHGRNQKPSKLIIKNGAYIGMGSVIISGKNGVTIGEGALIGAGSVVVKSIKPGLTACGNPAVEKNVNVK